MYQIKFILLFLVFLILIQFLEVWCICTPQLYLSLRPHVHNAIGYRENDRTNWMPLEREERGRERQREREKEREEREGGTGREREGETERERERERGWG
jgi:hypothetical protein